MAGLTLNATSYSFTSVAALSSATTSLTINGGTGGYNTVSIPNSIPAGATVTVHGGVGGPNTLAGPNAANTWSLHGVDAGAINGNILFDDIQNLVGGNGDDDFVFGDGAFLSGSIDGGAGFNILDYSNDNPDGVHFTWFVGPPPDVPPPYSGAATPLMGGTFSNIWDFNPEPSAGPLLGPGGIHGELSPGGGENLGSGLGTVLGAGDHLAPGAGRETRPLDASGNNSAADPGSRSVGSSQPSLVPGRLDALFGSLGDDSLAGLQDFLA
jgi:hypothetical protein